VDDRDYSSTLLLVEDDQNDVESTLAAWSEGVLGVLHGAEGQNRDRSGVLRILIPEDSPLDAELMGARDPKPPGGRYLRCGDHPSHAKGMTMLPCGSDGSLAAAEIGRQS
jgi:hypothetical protein